MNLMINLLKAKFSSKIGASGQIFKIKERQHKGQRVHKSNKPIKRILIVLIIN
jgi:hypothetical protein